MAKAENTTRRAECDPLEIIGAELQHINERFLEIDFAPDGETSIERTYRESEMKTLYQRQDILRDALSCFLAGTSSGAILQLAYLSSIVDDLTSNDIAEREKAKLARMCDRLAYSAAAFLRDHCDGDADQLGAEPLMGWHRNPWDLYQRSIAVIKEKDEALAA